MMMSAQQKKRASVKALIDWYRATGHEGLKEYIRRGQLNRSLISNELCFSRSSWGSNKRLKKALNGIEQRLRSEGILPPIKIDPSNYIPVRDRSESKRLQSVRRLEALEKQNASLQAELDAAKDKLKQANIYDLYLAETGRMPR